MPSITSVEPQKKNLKRFNVFLDGKFAFGADEDLIVDHRLVVGKIIEAEDLEKLLFEAEVGKLMEKMYNWFSFRQHSEKETRDYLKNLSFKRKVKDMDEISEIVTSLLIERLKKKGLINDLEFAKAWVDARRRSKQKGINALKSELYQKGIDREIVEEVLSIKYQVLREDELAASALNKKMKSWDNLEPQKQKQKALEYLIRKGFNYDTAKEVIEKMMKIR